MRLLGNPLVQSGELIGRKPHAYES